MNIEKSGFKKLSYNEQSKIASAGAGVMATLGSVFSKIFNFIGLGGIGNIFSMGTSIINQSQQKKLIETIKNANKGEVEFGKDGSIKIKWDESKPTQNVNSTVIF